MADQSDYGFFLPTTYLFGNESQKELTRNLYRNVNSIILAVNAKDTGIYELTEFINGQVFFSNPALTSLTPQTPTQRQVFRKVINFGALPNTGTTSVAHGIAPDSTFTFTRIYGTASDTTGLTYIPLPYASSTAANNIEIHIDVTNVNIITGIDRTAFDTTYVILEYLKQ